MKVGTHRRTEHDSRVVGVDFRDEPDFVASPVTGATVTVAPGTGTSGAAGTASSGTLTAGAPDWVTTPNVVAFRLTGGAAGDQDAVTVRVTNAAGDVECRSVAVLTDAC